MELARWNERCASLPSSVPSPSNGAVCVQWPPYVIESNASGTPSYTGLCVDLLDILSHRLNFSYTLVVSPDGEFGDKRDNRWTGLMGLLERKEVDLTNAPVIASPERGEVADWTTPIGVTRASVAVLADQDRLLGNGQAQWRAFLVPFTWTVYVYTVCTLLCFTCLMYVMVTCQHQLRQHHRKTSLCDVVLFIFGSSIKTSISTEWANGSTKMLVASWSLLGLVLTSAYTCQLASLFVDMTSKPPFTSLEEMVQRDDFRWGLIGGSKHLLALRNSEDPVYQEVYAGIQNFAKDDPDVLHLDPEVHLRKVLQGGYAYIGGISTVRQWASKFCDVTVLDQTIFGIEFYVFAAPKNSTKLVEETNSMLLRLQATGIISHLESKWLPAQASCHDSRSSQSAISVGMMQGPCYAAVAGLCLATGVFLLEISLRKYTRQRERGLDRG